MKTSNFKPVLLSLLALVSLLSISTYGQQAGKQVCDEGRAVLLAEKQVEEVVMLDQPQKRIAVMIRAADVLWNIQQSNARKIFTDAFALAEQRFKEKGDETAKDGSTIIRIPDQRFIVMRAIAMRDPAWAKKLAERIAEESRREAEEKTADLRREAAANSQNRQVPVQDKMLNLAAQLASVDSQTSLALARSTFNTPLSYSLAQFLYALADVRQGVADQFYQEALTNYARAPIADFLNLSAYPFVRERLIGPEIFMRGFRMPQNVEPNSGLQQLFIEGILRRAEANIKNPQEQPVSGMLKLPEASQLLIALTHLEALASQFQPSYVNRILEVKAYLNGSLNNDMRLSVNGMMRQHEEMENRLSGKGDAFLKYSQQAEHEANSEKRNQALAFAVLNASDDKEINDLIGVARKVDDENLRPQLLTFIYFKRAQKLIKEKRFVEAMQLAKNIDRLDYRAYLAYEMAAAALKNEEEKPRVREILEDVLELAYKAPGTNEKARTLLGVVHLYAKIDKTQAFKVMSEAVTIINQIENPDFFTTSITQKIEAKQFVSYRSYTVEGFSLETVFRLITPMDFEGALWRATSFTDKAQRGLAVLAVVSSCMEENERLKKIEAEKKKKAARLY
jgi:hypothetical protein